MAFIYDLTDTWNAGGTTFNAIKMNVTDSASAAASKLVTLQVGGSERFGVDKAGIGTFASVIRAASGSASAPAFSFTGDTNTGMWSPAADTLAFSEGGVEVMRITSAGNVGINTSAPTERLDVNGRVRSRGSLGINASPPSDFWGSDGSANTALFTGYGNIGSLGSFGFDITANGYRNSSGTWTTLNTNGSTSAAQIRLQTSDGAIVFGSDATKATGSSFTVTERMRINSSGDLLVGKPAADDSTAGTRIAGVGQLSVVRDNQITAIFDRLTSDGVLIRFRRSNVNVGDISVTTTATSYNTSGTSGITGVDANTVAIRTNSTERMRITSAGELLVGKTAINLATVGIEARGTGILSSTRDGDTPFFLRRNTSDGTIANFNRDGSTVGTISVTTTATAYNTSSDYRLKDIDGPIQNSGAYIDALKPVQGSWKADGSRFIGLLAHEVQEVSETQIATGEKDGEEMQAMDYSAPEIIANLIAEIQSLRARVAQLEGN